MPSATPRLPRAWPRLAPLTRAFGAWQAAEKAKEASRAEIKAKIKASKALVWVA